MEIKFMLLKLKKIKIKFNIYYDNNKSLMKLN